MVALGQQGAAYQLLPSAPAARGASCANDTVTAVEDTRPPAMPESYPCARAPTTSWPHSLGRDARDQDRHQPGSRSKVVVPSRLGRSASSRESWPATRGLARSSHVSRPTQECRACFRARSGDRHASRQRRRRDRSIPPAHRGGQRSIRCNNRRARRTFVSCTISR